MDTDISKNLKWAIEFFTGLQNVYHIRSVKGKPLREWKIPQEIIDECGVFKVNEYNFTSPSTKNIKTNPILKTAQKTQILNIEWKINFDEEDVQDFDPVYGIWNADSKFALLVGEQVLEYIPLFAQPVLYKLYNPHYYKLNVQRAIEKKEVTFIFPIMSHLFEHGGVFPLVSNHALQIRCDLLPIGKYESATPKNVECVFTYLNNESNPQFDIQNVNNTEKIVYHNGWQVEALFPKPYHKVLLYFNHPSVGLSFAFIKNGQIVKDPKFLQEATLAADGRDIVKISDGNAAYGKCVQFIDNYEDEESVVKSALSFDNIVPVIFPIEVWSFIFHHVHNPKPLFSTCKFLYKVSRQPTVQRRLRHQFETLSGWYSLPFTDEKVGMNIGPTTLNLSRIDTLALTFVLSRQESGVSLVVLNRNLNVLRVLAEMMGLAYSN